MIDIHMHVGRLYYYEPKGLTPSHLLRFMDSHGIEKAALLPIESPEETHYYVTTDYVLRVAKRHPDRFIPFCNVDPRRGSADTSTDFRRILSEYADRGCRGLGELMAGVWIDDARPSIRDSVPGAFPGEAHLRDTHLPLSAGVPDLRLSEDVRDNGAGMPGDRARQRCKAPGAVKGASAAGPDDTGGLVQTDCYRSKGLPSL